MNKLTDLTKTAEQGRLSEKDLRGRLGHYVAPQGLYELNKARPFAGRVTCNVDRLVAGSWNEIVLDYEVGASGIADGAWFNARLGDLPGSAIHNPFLVEQLLRASIQAITDTYGVSAPIGYDPALKLHSRSHS